jgi:hypothetical protein
VKNKKIPGSQLPGILTILKMQHKYKTVSVPLSLLRLVLEKKSLRALRFFLYLKINSPGKFQVRARELELLEVLRIADKRTLRSFVKVLVGLNFIGQDLNNGMVFLRSWKRIYKNHKLSGRSAARLYPESLKTQADFNAWVTGAFASSISRNIGRRRSKQVFNVGDKTEPRFDPPRANGKVRHGLAVRYFALALGLTYSKSQRMLKQAAELKSIKRIKVEVPLDFRLNGELFQATPFDLPFVYKQFPELFGRVRLRRNVPFIRLADEIFSNVELTRKPKAMLN